MKIIRVVTLGSKSGQYGGPFDTACRQVEIANAIGFESRLMTGYFEGDAPDSKAVPSRSALVAVKRRWIKRGFVTAISKKMIVSLYREIRVSDVIHVSFARELVPLLATMFGLFLKKRVILQPHGMLTSRSSRIHSLVDLIVRPLTSRASAIVALTAVEAEDLRSWMRSPESGNIFVLGNPVANDLVGRIRSAPSSNSTVFIARLHRRKRAIDFSNAALYAERQGWHEKYRVIGPDEGDLVLLKEIIEQVSNLVYGGSIPASAVSNVLDSSGVFVLPSENEPWGNVLATAISLGIPVVVSESAALSSLIGQYGAGLIVPDYDSEAIARSVHVLLTDEQLYKKASIGALAMSRDHLSRERQIRGLSKLYELSSNVESDLLG